MIFHKQLYATPCQLVVQRYPYYVRSDFKVGFFFNKFMEKAKCDNISIGIYL